MFFDISLSGFINFFFGIITGMIVFSAIYVYFTIRGKNINLDEIKLPTVDVKEEKLKEIIVNKQKQFKRNKKLGNQTIARLTFDMSYELLEEIATYFFPESKYPMLELSVNEFIDLNHYISDRVDEILEQPILKNTKNVRVTKIVQMYDKKKAIEQARLVKAAKKYKVGKVLKLASAAVNIVNPVYWFRKLVINTSVDIMTKKVCTVIIGIVGEETTKIYSKKLFDKEIELDVVEKEVDQFLESGDFDDEED